MMKKTLFLGGVLFLLLTLVACGQCTVETEANERGIENDYEKVAYPQEDEEKITDGEIAIDFIEFSTLEDFLSAYIAVGAGENAANFVKYWSGVSDYPTLESTIEGVDFLSLETLYLPVGIPSDFEVGKITVTESYVNFWFFPVGVFDPDRDSFWDTVARFPHFEFGFDHRWDVGDSVLFDAMLAQSTDAEILIDGKYLFRPPNAFSWVSSGMRFGLRTPLAQQVTRDGRAMASELADLSIDNPHEMLLFTETMTINLRDTNEVTALIEELTEEARR